MAGLMHNVVTVFVSNVSNHRLLLPNLYRSCVARTFSSIGILMRAEHSHQGLK